MLCEVLTGWASDRVNCQHSGESDQIFFQKSQMPGGGGCLGQDGGDGHTWIPQTHFTLNYPMTPHPHHP